MSLPQTAGGYALGAGEEEALWFNGGLGILKATADQAEGRYTADEVRLPKRFVPPLHGHENEDEFFVVLSGEVRLQHGEEEVVEGVAGSFAYTPRGVGQSFRADAEDAQVLFFGPAGVEGVFREAGTPARSVDLSPAGEPVPDREPLTPIMSRFGQTVLGPPMHPRTSGPVNAATRLNMEA